MTVHSPTASTIRQEPQPVVAVRSRFLHADRDPYLGDRIYFENAGGGLTLKTVVDAAAHWAALPDNAGRRHATSQHLDHVLTEGQAAVATLMGAVEGTIATRESTTACVYAIFEAIAHDRGRPNQNIVCSELDHASTCDAAAYVQRHYGVERRIARLSPDRACLCPDAVLACVDENTIAVSLIHASNITGAKLELSPLVGELRARAPRAFILVDGAQHVQHALIDVAAYGVDAYIFSAYKAFSKAGAAFAYLSPQLAQLDHPRLQGSHADQWNLGTRDAGNYAAMIEVVRYLDWLGRTWRPDLPADDTRAAIVAAMHGVEAYEATLTHALLHGYGTTAGLLADPRVTVHGERDATDRREAVVAVSVEGAPTDRIVRELAVHGVIVHDRVCDAYSGHTLRALGVNAVVRISLAHYNTADEVRRFLEIWPEATAAARSEA